MKAFLVRLAALKTLVFWFVGATAWIALTLWLFLDKIPPVVVGWLALPTLVAFVCHRRLLKRWYLYALVWALSFCALAPYALPVLAYGQAWLAYTRDREWVAK